ncbi:MAG: hypothetical protein Q9164_003877 [Protoblastenia rupestris]
MSDNTQAQLTFGVEFECILAFHESLLQAHLNRINDPSRIIKSIPSNIRTEFNRAATRYLSTRRQYNSWALTGPTNYSFGPEECYFQDDFAHHLQKYGYRGYGNEVLHITKSVLPEGVEVHGSFNRKREDFSKWHLAHDTSLLGADRKTLKQVLTAKDVWDTTDWDSHGIELVTRVLPYTETSFQEIDTYLDMLKGPEYSLHKAFTSSHCGLHVHVGFATSENHVQGKLPPPPTFPLPTLQHLAYILVMYESAISRLHPVDRREGSPSSLTDIASNLDNFYQEPVFDNNNDDDDDDDDKSDSLTFESLQLNPTGDPIPKSQDPPLSFAHARKLIFASDQTVEKLVKLMSPSGKNHIVNWTYLARTNGLARTIEFRQYEGCLDVEGVRWWVMFCCGLVGLAGRMAREYGVVEGYDGLGYREREWREGMEVGELFGLMGFEEEGREWFRAREARLDGEGV